MRERDTESCRVTGKEKVSIGYGSRYLKTRYIHSKDSSTLYEKNENIYEYIMFKAKVTKIRIKLLLDKLDDKFRKLNAHSQFIYFYFQSIIVVRNV